MVTFLVSVKLAKSFCLHQEFWRLGLHRSPSAKCGLRRRRDVGAYRKRGSVSTLRKIEDDDGHCEKNGSAHRQQTGPSVRAAAGVTNGG